MNNTNQTNQAAAPQTNGSSWPQGQEPPIRLRQPEGWRLGPAGIFARESKDTEDYTLVCRTPILITRCLTMVSTQEGSLELAFLVRGSWKTVIVPRAEIFTANGPLFLCRYNALVNAANARRLSIYLTELLQANEDIIPFVNLTDHAGWSSDTSFIPYDKEIVPDQGVAAVLSAIHPQGDLNQWLAAMKPHRDRWQFRAVLAAGFAAPMLKILSARMFMLHLWGKSGCGKTTMLRTMLSIWGDPDRLMIHFNRTENAMQRWCAIMKDLPVGIDEKQISGVNSDLSTFIYTLMEGVGRGRLRSNCTMMETETWRNIVVTTGEEPIIGSGTMTGVSTRIIEIECKPFECEQDAAEMLRFISGNYGTAGEVFVDALSKLEHDKLRRYYDGFCERLSSSCSSCSLAHVHQAALLGLADFLVSCLFYYETEQDAGRSARIMAEELLVQLCNTQPEDVDERAISFIRDWLVANKNHMGETKLEFYGYSDDENVYVLPSALDQALLGAGFNPRKTRSALAERGILMKSVEWNGKRHYTTVKNYQGKRIRFLAMQQSALYTGLTVPEPEQLELA